jgi:hypothetical protein
MHNFMIIVLLVLSETTKFSEPQKDRDVEGRRYVQGDLKGRRSSFGYLERRRFVPGEASCYDSKRNKSSR